MTDPDLSFRRQEGIVVMFAIRSAGSDTRRIIRRGTQQPEPDLVRPRVKMTNIANYRRLSKEVRGMAESLLLKDQRDALLKMAGEYEELAKQKERQPSPEKD